MGRGGRFHNNVLRRASAVKKVINLALLAANCIAIFFYLRNASLAWAIPEEAGLDPATLGPSMVWGLGALPILLGFILVDGVWWYIAVSRRTQKWPVLAGSLFWGIAVLVDFMHH